MRWFGKAYGCPYEADTPHAPIPLGQVCSWCDEPIGAQDDGVLFPYDRGELAYHYECHMRKVVGGLNHQLGRCYCCGGDAPPDPPELGIRQAAIEAVEHWTNNNRHRPENE